MDCEFKQVDVQYLGNSGAYICWRLSSDAVYFSGEYQFYVDFGWPATDTWITLNEQPIIDDCCYYDVCKRNWATLIEAYYRVRLILPGEPGCPVYKSQPVRANGMLSRKDWLVARDIVRREYLQQKYETTRGKLFVRKKFGRACPVCLDWDTKEITNSDCPVCYGTGIVGGYYPVVDYNITTQPGWNRRIVSGEPPRGTHSDITKPTNRSVLYPAIDTRDVWLRSDNGERYIIDSYTVIAQFKSVPLIVSPVLKLAPMTDIVYSIPLVPSSSSSSSSVSSMSEATCDVNSGLDSSYEDW
jgi:hypothetical protein